MPGILRRSFADSFIHLEQHSCLCYKPCLRYRWNNPQFSRPLYFLEVNQSALEIILLWHHAALFSGSCCGNNRPFHILAASHQRNKRNTKLCVRGKLHVYTLLVHGDVHFDSTRTEYRALHGDNSPYLAPYNSDKEAINIHLDYTLAAQHTKRSFSFVFATSVEDYRRNRHIRSMFYNVVYVHFGIACRKQEKEFYTMQNSRTWHD